MYVSRHRLPGGCSINHVAIAENIRSEFDH
jgi:hypothetical protein